ncbi:MAG: hypothetical protein GWO07_16020 [Candidatus Dadabacteria bacterium]|nr:hypothetical protein [Candidatus Dadabacteria bacterium]NIS10210.1 hypothetical protein [Candidatus Dadabacteria bacterium]NIV42655.1 hypothetical protein [Candidatus Dadabacteria bacterium]NIX16578.1 hypothetical protein [Candidatus Dadabacteria bacterium]NIY23125.1 hypothetical protein [Candidatus Dadabacteria bacterium]
MKKKRKSDLNTARLHFQNAAREGLIASAYMLKGMREMSESKNYRKQILENTSEFIDQGLDLFIKFAEAMNEHSKSAQKSSSKAKKKSRKIEID